MFRSIGSVLAGELTLLASSFAMGLLVDAIVFRAPPHSFANQQALAASRAVMVITVFYTVLCSLLAGYVTARAAGKKEVKHAMALAALQVILTATLILKHPGMAPTWVWACNITLVPLAIVLGGRIRAAQAAGTSAT